MSRPRPAPAIERCRVCHSPDLERILDLGEQALTGVFPATIEEGPMRCPLQLVKCDDRSGEDRCGLVQLRHQIPPESLYGEHYGYRSSLNRSMVDHLRAIVADIRRRDVLRPGDLVVDIGCNDGTLLAAFDEPDLDLVGVDPAGRKWRPYVPEHIRVIPEFFSSDCLRRSIGERKAKVVTAIAVFYDLPDPVAFARQVAEILDDDGIWVIEQSYLPRMLECDSYDTVCHEHLEYYGLRQIRWIMDRAGLEILDVGRNETNGGSFCVTLARRGSGRAANRPAIARLLALEEQAGMRSLEPFRGFARRIEEHRDALRARIAAIRRRGEVILGYGASTKGNVLLQYCGFTREDLPCIADVNRDKWGCLTPGTWIPIVGEEEAKAMNPDYFLVLPWHFRDAIVRRESEFLARGGRLLLPLPRIEEIQSIDAPGS